MLQVPQLDRVIPAPANESPSIRVEGEGIGSIGMRLPVPAQGMAFLFPYPYFPPLMATAQVASKVSVKALSWIIAPE